MSRSLAILFASVSVGCYSPEVPLDTDGPPQDSDGSATQTESGRDTDPSSSSGTTEPTMGSGDPTTASETDPSGDTDPASDDPPVIDAFSVNDSQTPEDVTRSSLVRLSAEVTDDVAVATVEFFDGDTPVGTATEAPYEVEVLVTSTDSGGHVYTARATDSVGQEATSDEVQLFVDVTGGEIVDINEGLFEGCVVAGNFGGISIINEDRFAVSATGCEQNTLVVVANASLEEVSSGDLPGIVGRPASTMEDGRILVPTAVLFGKMAGWHYNVFDPQVGSVDPGAGLLLTDVGQELPGAAVVPSGVFIVRSANEVAVLEADLDADVWSDNLGLGGDAAAVGSIETDEEGNLFLAVGSDGCPSSATNCLVKYNASGERQWTRGMASGTFYGGLAASGDGGVFAALFTDTAFLVGRHNADGDEVASRLLSYPEDRSTFPRITSDGQGGIVLVAAHGAVNNTGQIPDDESVMTRLDRNLDTLWEVSGLGPGQSRAVALRGDARGGLLLVGIEFTESMPTLFASEGSTWLASVNL